MRGNPDKPDPLWIPKGSIPAHAGEPLRPRTARWHPGVYPRACGGTSSRHVLQGDDAGLSPRMRGNRRDAGDAGARCGSIPAHAGEPSQEPPAPESGWVYPRACGGTRGARARAYPPQGLSPRMRGNLLPDLPPADLHGSIPAHAGEPACCRVEGPAVWVYPRACGGTNGIEMAEQSQQGLSPRMRGNPRCARLGRTVIGSIPAHAGEPPRYWRISKLVRVYPRACGGTFLYFLELFHPAGLSPRMRGNRRRWSLGHL